MRTRILSAAILFLAVGTTILPAQGRGQQDPPGQKQDDKKQQPQKPVPPKEQQQRAQQEQQRATQYKKQIDAQVQVAQKQAAQLQTQKRVAQARTQEQYTAQLRQQQQQLQTARDYTKDPYVSTPHTYRYVVSGNARQTNQYGADVLRSAVGNGYQQGFAAGKADHDDHRRSSYQTTFGYKDANYGFSGNYVAQSDYNYYFRQGFSRGYSDGFNTRTQYGTTSSGAPVILGALLIGILALKALQ